MIDLNDMEKKLDEALSKETKETLTDFVNMKRNKMNNVFVSYEVASELKELGFDESCFGYYDCERDFKFLPDKSKFLECEFAAPTFSQAFRFFREKYDLFGCIDLHVSTPLHWYVRIDKISINDYVYHSEDDSKYYVKYEDAELACLMKLIEIVENV